MATSNIDKALYPADGGLPELLDMGEPALEIEIENPDSVTLADGSMEITIEPGKEVSGDFNRNLAEDMEICVRAGLMPSTISVSTRSAILIPLQVAPS